MKQIFSGAMIGATTLALAAMPNFSLADTHSNTIVDAAVATPALSTLVTAVTAAELVETLSSDGPFTVFAPINDAFGAINEDTLDALLADPAGALTEVLTYHVVSGVALSSDLSDNQTIETLNGQDVTVNITNDQVMINNATVVIPDIEVDNGVVHVIDSVLVPQPPAQDLPSIVEIATGSEDFSILVAALANQDLVNTLSDEGPFTVFAPTDAAFEKLPAVAVRAILNNPETLRSILLNHVVAGNLNASQVLSRGNLQTVGGATLNARITHSQARIANATISQTDITASNGVVHILDEVIIPEPVAQQLLAQTQRELQQLLDLAQRY